MKAPTLEPCPWCSSPTVQVRDLPDGIWFLCFRKGCNVEVLSDYETVKEAIKHWNTRASSPDSIAEKARRIAEQVVPDCLSRTCFIKDCHREHCWGCDDARAERERAVAIITAEFTAGGNS